MQTTTGDHGALVAAALTQAEMSLRGGAIAASSGNRAEAVGRRFIDYRGTVARSYEYYLTLVTTGQAPAAQPTDQPAE